MEKNKIYYAFLFLSLICIIIFILQNLFLGFTDMFVLTKAAHYHFEIYRYLTAIFLHGDIVHLLYNLFALLFFGFILEKKIGTKNFLIVFFLSGIISNIIGVTFYNSSLGASGAIYGILGCLAVINPFMIVFAFGLIMPMFIAAILWIIGDILGVFGFGSSNIGYYAHISGVIVGLVIGIIFRLFFIKKSIKNQKLIIDENLMRAWEGTYMR